MKKLSLLLVIASCTGLLLSSCGKLENISVSKRHYRGGYYVDLGSGKQDVSTHTTAKNVTPASTASTTAATAEDKSAVIPAKETALTTPLTATAPVVKKKHAAKTVPMVAMYASTQSTASVKEDAKTAKLNASIAAIEDQDMTSETGGSDVPYWLLIVLCILLPPLAVGLKFGIVDKFWISLLLTLLFWLPGVIYALIVVTEK